jgi:predicted nucleic-acid-binding protein
VKALDTNVVVRFLVADDAGQAAAVGRLFQKAEEERERLFISLPVVLETIWVLTSVYDCPRGKLIEALERLRQLPCLRFDRVRLIDRFLEVARESHADPADLLIGLAGAEAGCDTTITFDRRLAKTGLFEVV